MEKPIQLGLVVSNSRVATDAQEEYPQRDLLHKDFSHTKTLYFPCEGSEKTPSHNYYAFNFTTYAPFAFQYFRNLFGVKQEDFLMTLNKPLRQLSNPGASGMMFYMTADDVFVIKTVQRKEAKFLMRLLPQYYMNLYQNPQTLLPKFFGLYEYEYETMRQNIRIVVTNNLLPSSLKMHQKYDLKGSTFKRRASKHERSKDSPVLKDLDFCQDYPDCIGLDCVTYDALMTTIKRDCLVLESFAIMDYSLLLGIHNVDLALKEQGLHTNETSSEHAPLTQAASLSSANSSGRVSFHRISSVLETINAKILADSEKKPGNDFGGIPAKSPNGDRLLLFLGIIDILQYYGWTKAAEHTWKALIHDGDTVSVHRPKFYSGRFQKFLENHVFRKMSEPPLLPPVPAVSPAPPITENGSTSPVSSQRHGPLRGQDLALEMETVLWRRARASDRKKSGAPRLFAPTEPYDPAPLSPSEPIPYIDAET